MTENWIKWEPIHGLGKKYNIDSISDTAKEFSIVLSEYYNEKKKVHVVFEKSVASYRNTDESFRLTTMHSLGQKYSKEFYGEWTFFKVANSSYIQWLLDESYVNRYTQSFIHFSFIAGDSILDIVTTYEPTIELINE